MNVKNRVLEILEKRIGENISGEEMAKTLGISRNSVWKAIKALKDDGYDISAQTKNGYVLSCENDLFTAHSINKLLNKKCNVIIYDERDSSNNVAKELAQNGEKDGTLVGIECYLPATSREFFEPLMKTVNKEVVNPETGEVTVESYAILDFNELDDDLKRAIGYRI
jgi:BirA family biotin operon repressor/biotin-[acetyl-CoA-carboxylase] ligase